MLRENGHNHNGEKLRHMPRELIGMLVTVEPAGEKVIEVNGHGEIQALFVPTDNIDNGKTARIRRTTGHGSTDAARFALPRDCVE